MESFKATLVRDDVMNSIISDDFLKNTLISDLIKDKTEDQKKTIISDLVYTNWILLNMEYSILFTGNMDYYSNPHKRFGGEGSTGMYLINSNIISSKIKNENPVYPELAEGRKKSIENRQKFIILNLPCLASCLLVLASHYSILTTHPCLPFMYFFGVMPYFFLNPVIKWLGVL